MRLTFWSEGVETLITDDAFLGSSIEAEFKIMQVPPNISFTLPLDDFKRNKPPEAQFEFILYFDSGRFYHGRVVTRTISLANNTIQIDGEHIVLELNDYRIPTNYGIIEQTLYSLYVGDEKLKGKFNHRDWTFDIKEDTKNQTITYLFSNQNKLEALDLAVRQTESLFWRVSSDRIRTIEIGEFGEQKEVLFDEDDVLDSDIQYIEDYSDIVNYGIFFTEKSDAGSTSLTLRDVFERKELHDENFPIHITGQIVNTERSQKYEKLAIFGANNTDDYAVEDKEGIALEAGRIYEGSFSANDIQTIAKQNEELTDEDRLNASKQLYRYARRKLLHSRRKFGFKITVPKLDKSVYVGDKIRFVLKPTTLDILCTGNYERKIMDIDDWFYINALKESVSYDGHSITELTLEKFLYNDSEA